MATKPTRTIDAAISTAALKTLAQMKPEAFVEYLKARGISSLDDSQKRASRRQRAASTTACPRATLMYSGLLQVHGSAAASHRSGYQRSDKGIQERVFTR